MKIYISISANVYNLDALQQWLQSFGVRQNIQQWLSTTVRKYIIEDENLLLKLPKTSSLVEDGPEWALKALKNGTLFYFDSRKLSVSILRQDLEHAIGWLRTFPDKKKFNVSVEEAIQQGNLYITTRNKMASDKEGDTLVLHTFKNGWKIVSCLDSQSLKREGKIMQHCVGNDEQDYIQRVSAKTLQIWSLRDPSNQPHCTMEYSVRDQKVQQIKGKQNKGVVKKYQHYVVEWLKKAYQDGLIEEFNSSDLVNIGILDQDGIWYNLYNLPENFTIKGNL